MSTPRFEDLDHRIKTALDLITQHIGHLPGPEHSAALEAEITRLQAENAKLTEAVETAKKQADMRQDEDRQEIQSLREQLAELEAAMNEVDRAHQAELSAQHDEAALQVATYTNRLSEINEARQKEAADVEALIAQVKSLLERAQTEMVTSEMDGPRSSTADSALHFAAPSEDNSANAEKSDA